MSSDQNWASSGRTRSTKRAWLRCVAWWSARAHLQHSVASQPNALACTSATRNETKQTAPLRGEGSTTAIFSKHRGNHTTMKRASCALTWTSVSCVSMSRKFRDHSCSQEPRPLALVRYKRVLARHACQLHSSGPGKIIVGRDSSFSTAFACERRAHRLCELCAKDSCCQGR